jgi:hypothetical protein
MRYCKDVPGLPTCLSTFVVTRKTIENVLLWLLVVLVTDNMLARSPFVIRSNPLSASNASSRTVAHVDIERIHSYEHSCIRD